MTVESKPEIQLLSRKTVLDEISFRMDKLWRIFSWTSTVLVAIIGGTIALRTGDHTLSPSHQAIVAGAAFVLGVYAIAWLRQNLKLEEQARDALEAHDKALGITSYNDTIGGTLPRPDRGVVVGYKLTVALLTLAAILAAFVPLAIVK